MACLRQNPGSFLSICLFFSLLSCAKEKFTEWDFSHRITVVESSGEKCRSFPVSFNLPGERLVGEGKLNPDYNDIRITMAGAEVPCQIEKPDDGQVKVTFQIDLEPGETRDDVTLYYGNPSAPELRFDRSWGSISPQMDGLENSLFKITFGVKTGTYGKKWGCQNGFIIKKYEEDQFGGDLIPDSWGKSRNDVTYWRENVPARIHAIEADGPVFKTVLFQTDSLVSDDHGLLTNLTQRVTIYKDCPFIREEYRNIKGAVVDACTPGGMPLRSDGERNFNFIALNFDSQEITWNGIGDDHGTRGGWDYRKSRADTDARYRYLDDYTYHGHFMMGVINIHNNRGVASCVWADHIRTCYFSDWDHDRAAYSLWPRTVGRMTRYLYYVENGREEAVSWAKLLAQPPRLTVRDLK